jgi:hypothetical protein
MNLWRINLKPASAVGVDAVKFCMDEGVVGIGWGLDVQSESPEAYLERASAKAKADRIWGRGWKAASNALVKRIQENDLIWTRDRTGSYFLGRLHGGWRPLNSDEAQRADIRNVWQCEWRKVGAEDMVPGAVVNGFRRGKTVQLVKNETAHAYSQLLFNRRTNRQDYKVEVGRDHDLLRLLSDQDLEDVVGLYLQAELGYLIYPSTCKKDTLAVEFIWVKPDGSERGGVQVKGGNMKLDQDKYANWEDTLFLFAASGDYGEYKGKVSQRVTCLQPDVIRTFIRSHKVIMPRQVQVWVERLESLRRPPDHANFG